MIKFALLQSEDPTIVPQQVAKPRPVRRSRQVSVFILLALLTIVPTVADAEEPVTGGQHDMLLMLPDGPFIYESIWRMDGNRWTAREQPTSTSSLPIWTPTKTGNSAARRQPSIHCL